MTQLQRQLVGYHNHFLQTQTLDPSRAVALSLDSWSICVQESKVKIQKFKSNINLDRIHPFWMLAHSEAYMYVHSYIVSTWGHTQVLLTAEVLKKISFTRRSIAYYTGSGRGINTRMSICTSPLIAPWICDHFAASLATCSAVINCHHVYEASLRNSSALLCLRYAPCTSTHTQVTWHGHTVSGMASYVNEQTRFRPVLVF